MTSRDDKRDEGVAIQRALLEWLQAHVFQRETYQDRQARGAIQEILNNSPGGVCFDGSFPSPLPAITVSHVAPKSETSPTTAGRQVDVVKAFADKMTASVASTTPQKSDAWDIRGWWATAQECGGQVSHEDGWTLIATKDLLALTEPSREEPKRSATSATPSNDPSSEVQRLTRELDVAMHGEAGAAKQASLCDLIPLARRLRAEVMTNNAKYEGAVGACAHFAKDAARYRFCMKNGFPKPCYNPEREVHYFYIRADVCPEESFGWDSPEKAIDETMALMNRADGGKQP